MRCRNLRSRGEGRAARELRFSEDKAAGPPPLPKRDGSLTMAFGDGTKVTRSDPKVALEKLLVRRRAQGLEPTEEQLRGARGLKLGGNATDSDNGAAAAAAAAPASNVTDHDDNQDEEIDEAGEENNDKDEEIDEAGEENDDKDEDEMAQPAASGTDAAREHGDAEADDAMDGADGGEGDTDKNEIEKGTTKTTIGDNNINGFNPDPTEAGVLAFLHDRPSELRKYQNMKNKSNRKVPKDYPEDADNLGQWQMSLRHLKVLDRLEDDYSIYTLQETHLTLPRAAIVLALFKRFKIDGCFSCSRVRPGKKRRRNGRGEVAGVMTLWRADLWSAQGTATEHHHGRVQTVLLRNLLDGSFLAVTNVYALTTSAKKDEAMEVCDAIEQALDRDDAVPALVAGDFNGRLACELKGPPHANDLFVQKLLDELKMTRVGKSVPTYFYTNRAKTRRDWSRARERAAAESAVVTLDPSRSTASMRKLCAEGGRYVAVRCRALRADFTGDGTTVVFATIKDAGCADTSAAHQDKEAREVTLTILKESAPHQLDVQTMQTTWGALYGESGDFKVLRSTFDPKKAAEVNVKDRGHEDDDEEGDTSDDEDEDCEGAVASPEEALRAKEPVGRTQIDHLFVNRPLALKVVGGAVRAPLSGRLNYHREMTMQIKLTAVAVPAAGKKVPRPKLTDVENWEAVANKAETKILEELAKTPEEDAHNAAAAAELALLNAGCLQRAQDAIAEMRAKSASGRRTALDDMVRVLRDEKKLLTGDECEALALSIEKYGVASAFRLVFEASNAAADEKALAETETKRRASVTAALRRKYSNFTRLGEEAREQAAKIERVRKREAKGEETTDDEGRRVADFTNAPSAMYARLLKDGLPDEVAALWEDEEANAAASRDLALAAERASRQVKVVNKLINQAEAQYNAKLAANKGGSTSRRLQECAKLAGPMQSIGSKAWPILNEIENGGNGKHNSEAPLPGVRDPNDKERIILPTGDEKSEYLDVVGGYFTDKFSAKYPRKKAIEKLLEIVELGSDKCPRSAEQRFDDWTEEAFTPSNHEAILRKRQLDKAVGKNGLHVYPVRRGTARTKAINLYAMRRMAEQDIRLPRWEEAKLTPVTKKGKDKHAPEGCRPIIVQNQDLGFDEAFPALILELYVMGARTAVNNGYTRHVPATNVAMASGSIAEAMMMRGGEIVATYEDAISFFDQFTHHLMRRTMEAVGVPEGVIKRLMDLREKLTVTITTAGGPISGINIGNGAGQGTIGAPQISMLPLEVKGRFIARTVPGRKHFGRRGGARAVAGKLHCDDTSATMTGSFGAICAEMGAEASWICAETVMSIPNGAAKSATDAMVLTGGKATRLNVDITLPSGPEQEIVTWQRVGESGYTLVGIPERVAVKREMAELKSVQSAGRMITISTNAGVPTLCDSRGLLTVSLSGNDGYYLRPGTGSLAKALKMDIRVRRLPKSKGFLWWTVRNSTLHALCSWGGAGFPTAMAFKRAAGLDEALRTLGRLATSPQRVSFEEIWAMVAYLAGCEDGSALEYLPDVIDTHVAEESKVLQTMETLKMLGWRLQRTNAPSVGALARHQDGKKSAELLGGVGLWTGDADDVPKEDRVKVEPLMTPCLRSALMNAATQTKQRRNAWNAAREDHSLPLGQGLLTHSQRWRALGVKNALHLYGGVNVASTVAGERSNSGVQAPWIELSWDRAKAVFGGGHIVRQKRVRAADQGGEAQPGGANGMARSCKRPAGHAPIHDAGRTDERTRGRAHHRPASSACRAAAPAAGGDWRGHVPRRARA